ncbi:MAG: hypothetical protein PHO86_05860 [Bacilli bacterium]|nr:hypothetical protein [Bacilli bacterium]
MFSFLYPYPSKNGNISESIKNLHIEDIIQKVRLDNNFDDIATVLSEFETNTDTIYYRQEIIKDFIDNPLLYSCIEGYLRRAAIIGELYTMERKVKIDFPKSFAEFEPTKYDQCALSLISYADIVMDLLYLYFDFNKELSGYNLNSKALNELKNTLSETIKNDGFLELNSLMESIILGEGNYNIEVLINEKLRIENASLLMNYKKEKVDNAFQKKRKASSELNLIELKGKTLYEVTYFLSVATKKIINLITDIYDRLFSIFLNTIKELPFFKFALDYYELLNKLNVKTTFPIFDEDMIEISDIYDPNLAIKGYFDMGEPINISPNNFLMSKDDGGVLVVGENNTGKTVYTRAIGINQIFAQAGIFVAAKKAKLRIFDQIVTCYASKESSKFDGGRFETEVKELKEIIDKADEKTLIIINEVFQSTAESEGTEALYNVLSYLTFENITWLCVSHFLDLKKRRDYFLMDTNKKIKLLQTNIDKDKYYINEIKD